MITLVYRVESKEGLGCYRNFYSDNRFKGFTHLINSRPTPEEDEGIERGITQGELCGFNSLEQCSKWFSQSDLRYLEKKGFKLKRFKGIITAKGKAQILFRKV